MPSDCAGTSFRFPFPSCLPHYDTHTASRRVPYFLELTQIGDDDHMIGVHGWAWGWIAADYACIGLRAPREGGYDTYLLW